MVLHNRKIPAHSLPEGWTTLEDNHDATVSLFVPPQDAADPNDRSIVVYATSGGDGVLLTGDLAARGFQNLCASGLPGPVSLLKLPHHGSRGSRPEQFLDRLQPDLAFVSAGRDNPYGLPHPTSIAACRSRNIPLYRTDRQGTLIFSRDGPGRPWQVQCFMGVGD
jgi:competence protein ComEC